MKGIINESMNRIILLNIFIIIMLSCKIFAIPDNLSSYYNNGNNYYKLNQYDSALIEYYKLIEENISNPYLFYNIGNTYFQKNKTGMALLYFYRAHRLNPSDKDIINNINYLNSIIKNKRPNDYNFFKYSLNFITFLFLILIILLFIVLTVRLKITNETFRFISLYIMILLLLLNIATGFWLYSRYNREIVSKYAVVTVNTLTVYSGPANVYSKITDIYEGLEVEITDERYGFYRINIFGKDAGWVDIKGLSVI